MREALPAAIRRKQAPFRDLITQILPLPSIAGGYFVAALFRREREPISIA
jgi:hypothetical protein